MDEKQKAALHELRLWNRQLTNVVNSGYFFDEPFIGGQVPDADKLHAILLELAETVLPLLVRLRALDPELDHRLALKTSMMQIASEKQLS